MTVLDRVHRPARARPVDLPVGYRQVVRGLGRLAGVLAGAARPAHAGVAGPVPCAGPGAAAGHWFTVWVPCWTANTVP